MVDRTRITNAGHKHSLRREFTLLFALILGAFIVYALIMRGRRAPDVIIDEILYGQMARGIASGAGATWRGESVGLNSLYPYLLAPGWLVGRGPVAGYELARALSLAAACTTAIPVWLLARELLDDWRRWIAPVAMLAGSWMVFTSRLLAENLALPLAAGSLAALTIALVRGRARGWLAAAIGLALLAAAVRIQLVVLLGVIPAALVIDQLRDPQSRLRRASREALELRPQSAPVYLLPIFAGVLGRYGSAFDSLPSAGDVLYWSVNNLVELALLCGVVPLVALIALALRRDNWHHRKIGALLSVALPALILFVAQLGWFSAAHDPRPIDRYLVYLLPLLFVALAVAPGRIRFAHAAVASVVVAMLVFVVPGPTGSESDAISAWAARTFNWDPQSPSHTLMPLAIFVAAIGAGGSALLARSSVAITGRARALTIAVCVLVGAQLVVGSQWSWHFANARAANVERLMPPQRDWIDRSELVSHPERSDRRGRGDVAILQIAPVFSDIAYVNEFFNDRVKHAFLLEPLKPNVLVNGATCAAAVRRDGTIVANRACAPLPHRLLVTGRDAAITFANSVKQVTPPGKQMSLVETDGTPRVSSIVSLGCDSLLACAQLGSVRTYLNRAAPLSITLKGASSDAIVQFGSKRLRVPAGTSVRATVLVAGGARELAIKQLPSGDRSRPPKISVITLAGKQIYSAAINAPEAPRVARASKPTR